MSIFNKKQNIFKKFGILVFSLVFILNFIAPLKTLAATPTLSLDVSDIKGKDNKWSWSVNVKTTNIESGIQFNLNTYKIPTDKDGNVIAGNRTNVSSSFGKTTTKGLTTVTTYYILDPGTTYNIVATIPSLNLKTEITQKTPGEAPSAANGDPTLNVSLKKEQLDEATKKVGWLIGITTKNVPDKTLYKVETFGPGGERIDLIQDFQTKGIINGSAEYLTPVKLEPGRSYDVVVTIDKLKLKEQFGKTTLSLPAQPEVKAKDTNTIYEPLAPLPGLEGKIDTKGGCAFGTYLNILIKIFFGICAALAMLMIIIGGIQYMTSELVSSKESAKESITHAILGFLLALAAYLILNTINPKLLNACLDNLPKSQITISPETDEKTVGIEGKTTSINGTTVTACNTGEMVPATLNGINIRGGVNKAILKDVQTLDAALAKSSYKITKISRGFECSYVGTNPAHPSAHAFGLAIDINPPKNPYKPGSTDCVSDMPQDFVDILKANGWGWGGNFPAGKDAMHISKLSTEKRFSSPCGNVK